MFAEYDLLLAIKNHLAQYFPNFQIVAANPNDQVSGITNPNVTDIITLFAYNPTTIGMPSRQINDDGTVSYVSGCKINIQITFSSLDKNYAILEQLNLIEIYLLGIDFTSGLTNQGVAFSQCDDKRIEVVPNDHGNLVEIGIMRMPCFYTFELDGVIPQSYKVTPLNIENALKIPTGEDNGSK